MNDSNRGYLDNLLLGVTLHDVRQSRLMVQAISDDVCDIHTIMSGFSRVISAVTTHRSGEFRASSCRECWSGTSKPVDGQYGRMMS